MDADERRIVSFTAVSHGLVHTYELSIPILLTVWVAEFSTTAAVLGLIVTVGYGLFGAGALPGGVLVDRFGSKPMIIACLLGMGGSFLLASLTPNLLTLAIAIAIWGMTASVYHPAGLSLLSKAIDQRGRALGYHGIGGNLGIALGPLATVLLLIPFDWRIVAALLTIPAVMVAIYGITVDVDEALSRAHERRSLAQSGSAADNGTVDDEAADGRSTDRMAADGRATDDIDPNEHSHSDEPSESTKGEISLANIVDDTRKLMTVGFVFVLLFVTFSGLYYRAFLTFLPDLLSETLVGLVDLQLGDPDSPYADEFDPARYLYVAILMIGVIGQYAGGRIADRIPSERGLLYVMGTLGLLSLLFIPARVTTATFVAVSMLLGITLFTVQPLLQATVAAYSAPEARGLSFGYTYLAIFGVGALGAGIAGTILTIAGTRELFVVLAVIAGCGVLAALAIDAFGTPRG